MLRILGTLLVLAGAAIGAVTVWETGSLPNLEPLSVAIGVAAGLFLGWLRNLPWGDIPTLLRGMIFRLTRSFGLLGLAALAASILLYY